MMYPKLEAIGYAPIWDPPRVTVAVSIDFQRILVELIAIIAFGLAVFYITGKSSR
jgi:hypothetical protein